MSDQKKTRPEMHGRKVPSTVLADVLMGEVHREAKARKIDLADKEKGQALIDDALAGKIGGEYGKAFAQWLGSNASTKQKETWPRTFRTYCVKYWKLGGVPDLDAKKLRLAPEGSAASLQAAVQKGVKKAAAKTPKTTAMKTASRKTPAKKAAAH
jgi:hypothetical protein